MDYFLMAAVLTIAISLVIIFKMNISAGKIGYVFVKKNLINIKIIYFLKFQSSNAIKNILIDFKN